MTAIIPESSLKGKSIQQVLNMKKGNSEVNVKMDAAQAQELLALVKEKGEGFDPETEDSSFNSTETYPYFKLVRYKMKACDCFLFYGGLAFALLFGCALPAMAFVFGRMVVRSTIGLKNSLNRSR